MEISTVIVGALSGAVYGFSSFAKNKGESFDFTKLATTVIIGTAAGTVLGLQDQVLTDSSLEVMASILSMAGFTAIAENGLKSVYRWFVSKVFHPKALEKAFGTSKKR